MNVISAGRDDTIEEVIQRLITQVIDNSTSQHILGNFTQRGQLNSKSLGVGNSEGDIYEIRIAAQLDHIVEVSLNVTYKIIRDPEDDSRLAGRYIGITYDGGVDDNVGKKKLSVLINSTAPEPFNLKLKEVSFTKSGGKREVLYREKKHEEVIPSSNFMRAIHNLNEDASLILHATHSDEPALRRFRRSNVSPWIIIGAPVGLATSIAAATIIAGGYGVYELVNLVVSNYSK